MSSIPEASGSFEHESGSIEYEVESLNEMGVAKVTGAIHPGRRGRVRFLATDWPARFYSSGIAESIPVGSEVHVVARQGLTLLVLPIQEKNKALEIGIDVPDDLPAEQIGEYVQQVALAADSANYPFDR